MAQLNNQVALVTGGASGLGRAIAQRLAADGARVVISDLQSELGTAIAAASGFTFLQHDVCDELRWGQVVGKVEERFGKLTILVNSAGILGAADAGNPENTRLADWRRIFSVNVEGTFLGCRTAIPAMRRADCGSIINISSIAGLLAAPGATAYGASKAAVRHLTKSVAQHCAQERLNIRCNSVHPGPVRTPLLEKMVEEVAVARGVPTDVVMTEIQSGVPMGDFTLPEDIAAAVSFLASVESRHITGTRLIVDGGFVECETYQGYLNLKHLAANTRSEPPRPESP